MVDWLVGRKKWGMAMFTVVVVVVGVGDHGN